MSKLVERVSVRELERRGAITAIQDGNHGELHPKATDYVDDGIPFIMANNFIGNAVDIASTQKLPQTLAEKLRIGFARDGDVLLTHKGTIGSTAIVDGAEPFWMLTPQVTYYRVNPEQLSNRYLMYAFEEPIFQATMKSRSDQATRPYIGILAQRELQISYRPLDSQKRIVHMLAPYDTLISNNRRRMELLERSARNLFREWFVRLRYPGYEHDKGVSGVPKGWERKPLGKIAVTNSASFPSKSLPPEINYIDISSVQSGRVLQKTRMTAEEAPGRARRRVKDGDVIWSNVRPNLRQFALMVEPDEDDVVSTGFTTLSPAGVPSSFLYLAVTTDAFVNHLINHATGVSYPAVRPDDFEIAQLLIPTPALLEDFNSICDPMFRLVHRLEKQNRKLAAARDLLLPRLMDGRLSV